MNFHKQAEESKNYVPIVEGVGLYFLLKFSLISASFLPFSSENKTL